MTTYIPAQASDYAAPASRDPSPRKTVFRADEIANDPQWPQQTKEEAKAEQKHWRQMAEESARYWSDENAAQREAEHYRYIIEQARRIAARKPADPAPLFRGRKFIALDTVEHTIHQRLGTLRQSDDDDRDECAERFNWVIEDYPREALRYFKERAQARGENWAALIAALTVKNKLKGAQHVRP